MFSFRVIFLFTVMVLGFISSTQSAKQSSPSSKGDKGDETPQAPSEKDTKMATLVTVMKTFIKNDLSELISDLAFKNVIKPLDKVKIKLFWVKDLQINDKQLENFKKAYQEFVDASKAIIEQYISKINELTSKLNNMDADKQLTFSNDCDTLKEHLQVKRRGTLCNETDIKILQDKLNGSIDKLKEAVIKKFEEREKNAEKTETTNGKSISIYEDKLESAKHEFEGTKDEFKSTEDEFETDDESHQPEMAAADEGDVYFDSFQHEIPPHTEHITPKLAEEDEHKKEIKIELVSDVLNDSITDIGGKKSNRSSSTENISDHMKDEEETPYKADTDYKSPPSMEPENDSKKQPTKSEIPNGEYKIDSVSVDLDQTILYNMDYTTSTMEPENDSKKHENKSEFEPVDPDRSILHKEDSSSSSSASSSSSSYSSSLSSSSSSSSSEDSKSSKQKKVKHGDSKTDDSSEHNQPLLYNGAIHILPPAMAATLDSNGKENFSPVKDIILKFENKNKNRGDKNQEPTMDKFRRKNSHGDGNFNNSIQGPPPRYQEI